MNKDINIGDCQLMFGDCLERMKELPDESVDLTVTSPPYDCLRSYNNNIDKSWTNKKWEPIIKELYRVTRNGGIVVWVVGDATVKGSETGTSFRQALSFISNGFSLHDTMIYKKNSSTFPASKNSKRYTQIFEYMFVFCKGKIRNDINLLIDKPNKWKGHTNWGKMYSYNKDGKKIKAKGINPVPEFSIRNNIWEYSTSMNEKTGHPAVFPERLAQDHILSWSNIGDVVLDIFMGSNTTGKMSILNGRKFIGIELDEKYYDISCKRIKDAINEKKQLLF